MFDEAFDFHDPFGNEGKKSSYSNPPQVERWQPLGAASTEENPATFRENESRYKPVYINILKTWPISFSTIRGSAVPFSHKTPTGCRILVFFRHKKLSYAFQF